MSKNLLAAARARLDSLRVRGDAQYVHVQQSSCVQSSAAAAATGAFTGSLGRNTCEERDTRARPRAAAGRGACWEGAGPSPCQGGGVGGGRDSQAERDNDQAGQFLWSPASISEAPGDPASPTESSGGLCVRLIMWGVKRSSRGGAFVLRGLPLSCQASLYL